MTEPLPSVYPNGTCYCGCGQPTNRKSFFVSNHDRKAESRVIRERFRDIATFVVWAEQNMPPVPDSR